MILASEQSLTYPATQRWWERRAEAMLTTQEFVEVKLQEFREEARRARLAAEAARSARSERKNGRWQWRVEPGMEGVFGSLLGWLLSSQRQADVEVLPSGREPPRTFAEQEGLEDEPLHPFECLFECWACR